jgi:hypothetical protein
MLRAAVEGVQIGVAATREAQALDARALRVVLDMNVLLSALIRVDSKPYNLVRAWLDGRFELVSSDAQLEALRRASRYEQVRRFLHHGRPAGRQSRQAASCWFVAAARFPCAATAARDSGPGTRYLRR